MLRLIRIIFAVAASGAVMSTAAEAREGGHPRHASQARHDFSPLRVGLRGSTVSAAGTCRGSPPARG